MEALRPCRILVRSKISGNRQISMIPIKSGNSEVWRHYEPFIAQPL